MQGMLSSLPIQCTQASAFALKRGERLAADPTLVHNAMELKEGPFPGPCAFNSSLYRDAYWPAGKRCSSCRVGTRAHTDSVTVAEERSVTEDCVVPEG